ncbi:MAG: TetR/AcrR family transcriptional regulator [Candidatus Dormibacteria bacterium]
MTAMNLGRRDRKKLQTHQALRAAALSLVAQRGLQQVTVEDIAEAADVSVRTFFNHFPSKEDAIIGLDQAWVQDIRDGLAARPADEQPLVAVWQVLGGLASAMLERAEEWPLRMEVLRANPTLLPGLWASFATYERALVEGIAARTGTDPDRDLYPALTATVAMSAFRAAMALWRSGKGGRPLPDLLDGAFAQVAAGLAPPPSGTAAHGGNPGRQGAEPGNRSGIKSRSVRTLPA